MGLVRKRFRRVKILFVVYGSYERRTGGYIYDKIVIEYLRSMGDTVDVLGLPESRAGNDGHDSGVRMLERTFSNETPYEYLVFDALVSREASTFLERFRGNAGPSESTGPCIVTLVHMLMSGGTGFTPDLVREKSSERILLELSDLIIVNSETTFRELNDQYGPQIPVHVCRPGKDAPDGNAAGYPGITESAGDTGPENTRTASYGPESAAGVFDRRHGTVFSRGHEKSGRPVALLCCGSVLEGKGFHRLAGILRSISGFSWKLTIAGDFSVDPEYTERLIEDFKASGFRDRLTLAGSIGPGDIRNLYADSDIFLQTSSHESYGIALAEAQYYGLPFVAFDTGAAAEVGAAGFRYRGNPVFTGSTRAFEKSPGFLVSGFSDTGFSACLGLLVENAGLRKLMGENARENGARLPSWYDTCRIFRNILLESVNLFDF